MENKLKQLQEPIPYKWRLQSAKNGRATMVAYLDARQVAQRLDDVVGAENWQSDFKIIDGNLFGGIGIRVHSEDFQVMDWVWKWDVGTESNVDKEKGEASDAAKRAAVQWGIGRFLYSLGIVTLKTATHTNGKEYPADDNGKIIWNLDDLTVLCNKAVAEGHLDRTKPSPKKANDSKPATQTPVKPTEPTNKPNSALQPSQEFDGDKPTEDKERRDKALKAFVDAKLNQDNAVIKHLVTKKKVKLYTKLEDFINGAPLDAIMEVYNELKK